MPVPTAVPPSGSSATRGSVASQPLDAVARPARRSRRTPGRASPASRPSGACARPSRRRRTRRPCASSAPAGARAPGSGRRRRPRWRRRGSRSGRRRSTTGVALTWSFGWTARPSRSAASVASTSFMFMLRDVPEPVWKTSIGNWSSWSPAATSSAAAAIAVGDVGRRCTPSSALTAAAARLDPGQRLDLRALEAQPGDREVLDRPLGLRLPTGVGRHAHLAHRVALDALLAHRLKSGTSASVNRRIGGMR